MIHHFKYSCAEHSYGRLSALLGPAGSTANAREDTQHTHGFAEALECKWLVLFDNYLQLWQLWSVAK